MAYAIDLNFLAAGAGEPSHQSNVNFIPGVGWRLASYNEEWWRKWERVDDDGPETLRSTGNGGPLIVAAGIEEVKRNRRSDELTGAYTGVVGLADEGDIYYQKAVPAGTDWDEANLAADQAAFPGPAGLPEIVELDRIYVTNQNFQPDDEWSAQFRIPGRPGDQFPGVIGILYYGAPAGADDILDGHGLYALVLLGNGMAWLMERGKVFTGGEQAWVTRKTIKWCSPNQVAGYTHNIVYHTDALETDTGWTGQTQVFSFSHFVDPRAFGDPRDQGNFVRMMAGVAANAISPSTSSEVYVAPRVKKTKTYVDKWRLDLRRDIRALWSIQRKKFHEEGTLRGATFSLPFLPSDTTIPIRLEFYGPEPGDAALDGTLYKKDGTELTLTSSGSIPGVGHYKFFEVDPNENYYYPEFTLGRSTTGDKSPTLQRYRIVRDGRQDVMDPGEFEATEFAEGVAVGAGFTHLRATEITSVAINGGDEDPTLANASFTIEDYIGLLPRLDVRGDVRVRVESEYDSSNSALRTVLFDGYAKPSARVARTVRRRGIGGFGPLSEYPKAGYKSYDVVAAGMWQRLEEALMPFYFDYRFNPDTQLPFKVTDVIRTLISIAGFAEDEIDIPDLPLLLWPDNGMDGSTAIEPLASIAENIIKLCQEYLGTSITWDGNAGAKGMWRLIPHKTAASVEAGAHSVLAEFYETTVPDLSGKVRWCLGSYSTTPRATSFIRSGSLHTRTIKPEGNLVIVSGTGNLSGTGPDKIAAFMANHKSFDFRKLGIYDASENPNGPDPDHPDWLGRVVPIVVCDPSIGGGGDDDENERGTLAAKWVCRRVFDFACHARKEKVFQAPLLYVTDPLDEHQTSPRPLRWYDPVYVDGELFLVRDVAIEYGTDKAQMATYELESPRF